jgi:hypothetical protein
VYADSGITIEFVGGTARVLAELGYSSGQIAGLPAAGVIR